MVPEPLGEGLGGGGKRRRVPLQQQLGHSDDVRHAPRRNPQRQEQRDGLFQEQRIGDSIDQSIHPMKGKLVRPTQGQDGHIASTFCGRSLGEGAKLFSATSPVCIALS